MVFRCLLLASFFLTIPGTVLADSRFRGFMIGYGTSAAEIADLAPWGANVIRYPILDPDADTHTEAEYNAFLESALIELDEVIAQATPLGVRVIIDMHTPPGGYVTRTGYPQYRLFSEKWAQDALFTTWTTIATRYKDNPGVFAYELLNEPAQKRVAAGLLNLDKLNRALVTKIREVDPVKKIIVSPKYADAIHIKKLRPVRDPNIIYSVHMFFPQKYTLQGILYAKELSYPSGKLNRKSIIKYLKPVREFQRKRRATIYIHEFGVVRWAPGAYQFLQDLIRLFESYKWNWTYLAFRGGDNVWSLEHNEVKTDEIPVDYLTARGQLLRSFFALNKS
jgi:endoglucanase